MDGTTAAVLRVITDLGFAVFAKTNEHGHEIVAVHSETGERFGVTDADQYRAACRLAVLLGVELDDG